MTDQQPVNRAYAGTAPVTSDVPLPDESVRAAVDEAGHALGAGGA
ncbi:hypothetical protein ACQEUX_24405 [Micromonospora sp. CA-259024]